jgi:AraC-like DNA-binding protein
LLQDSRLTLESIAERCGFADARHFRRLWKSVFHVPPGRARRSATAESATRHSRVMQGRATPDSAKPTSRPALRVTSNAKLGRAIEERRAARNRATAR